ncbi:MAG: DALR domain-containing protein, partial [Thermomicrobium sp.]|nr:cysteine--tRNA ligase [Thermomicrobium sp.]MDW8005471.1 DALR domain-containing protein [Thermomicrobium sp.]
LGGEKMSKSIGNLITIRELLERDGAGPFRLLVLSSHYRSPLTFTEEAFEAAHRGFERLRQAVRGASNEAITRPVHPLATLADETRDGFQEAMDDDFNTPSALARLFELARAINRARAAGDPIEAITYAQATLRELIGVLGFRFDESVPSRRSAEPFVELLIDVRSRLRAERRWELADFIRERLNELGVIVEDSPTGTTWRWA